MDAGITMGAATLGFKLSRWDLFTIMRLTAGSRPFRKVALPALAGFVFLGHAMDGNTAKGAVWAVAVAVIYWGVSNGMLLLHVYTAGNSTLLVPQEIELRDDLMVVTSEHSREEFARPAVSDVKVRDKYLVIRREDVGRLVFLRSSFIDPVHYEALKTWAGGS